MKESDRMTELVDELLDISKIDMGRQPLTLSEMDVWDVTRQHGRAVELAAGAASHRADFLEEPMVKGYDDT